MSEPLRTPPEAPVSEAEREALIEKLLLAGLDHYFEGSYEQAVNVWTRVVFLERGHGRARAYIDRARGALAERHRQAEELLHRGVEAYESGDLLVARDLLTRAVAERGANETALVFLQRLGRLDTGGARPAPAGAGLAGLPRLQSLAGLRTGGLRRAAAAEGTNWFSTVLVSLVAAGAILLLAQPVALWLGELPVSEPVAASPHEEALPIVRASEIDLARARELYENGRLRDALRVIDEIGLADPLRADADRLKIDIQRDLLATIDAPSVTSGEARR